LGAHFFFFHWQPFLIFLSLVQSSSFLTSEQGAQTFLLNWAHFAFPHLPPLKALQEAQVSFFVSHVHLLFKQLLLLVMSLQGEQLPFLKRQPFAAHVFLSSLNSEHGSHEAGAPFFPFTFLV